MVDKAKPGVSPLPLSNIQEHLPNDLIIEPYKVEEDDENVKKVIPGRSRFGPIRLTKLASDITQSNIEDKEVSEQQEGEDFKGLSSIDQVTSEQLSRLNKVHTAESLKVELEASQGVNYQAHSHKLVPSKSTQNLPKWPISRQKNNFFRNP